VEANVNSNGQDHETQTEEQDQISTIAQERRQEAQPILDRRPPEFILSTEHAEIAYNLPQFMLPFGQLNFSNLKSALASSYGVRFALPDIAKIMENAPATTVRFTEDQLAEMIVKSNNPSLTFIDGRFPIGPNDFVEIKVIRIHEQNLHVIVRGHTKAAELVASEVAEIFWSATGVPRRWDEIKKHIHVTTYATATKVDFGFPPERFLSERLRAFVDSDVLEGKSYAALMGGRSARHDFNAAPKATTIYTYNLEEFELQVHRFDRQSGSAEHSAFKIFMHAKDDRGTGRVLVASALPYDDHVECLRDLKSAFEAADS
jgi:hypothetical protein